MNVCREKITQKKIMEVSLAILIRKYVNKKMIQYAQIKFDIHCQK